MKTKLLFKNTFLLLFLVGLHLHAQKYYFRSKQSGDWQSASTWQSSTDNSTWANAVTYPKSDNTTRVDVLAGHTVDITNGTYIRSTHVNSGGVLKTNFEIGGLYTIYGSSTATNQLIIEDGGILQIFKGMKVIATATRLPILIKEGGIVSYENNGENRDYGDYFDPYFRNESDNNVNGLVIFENNSTFEVESTNLPQLKTSYIRKVNNTSTVIPNFLIKDENVLNNITVVTINALVKIDPSINIVHISSALGAINFLHGISGNGNIITDVNSPAFITFGSSSVIPMLKGTLSMSFMDGSLKFFNGLNVPSGASITFKGADPSESNEFNLAGSMNINGSVDLTNSTVEASGGEIAVQSGGVLRTSHEDGLVDFTTDNATFDPASTMEYYAAGDQTVSALTYGNLNLLGGSTKTFANNATANGMTTVGNSPSTVALVPADFTFTANGGITTNTADSFVIAKDGSLLQSSLANNGQAFVTVKRSTQIASPTNKYLFWSSPVQNQNMYTIFETGTPTYVMAYKTSNDSYPILSNPAPSVFGKAYSVRTPGTAGVSFKGVPNNGDFSYALSTEGNAWNLVGNPYPSNLDLHKFYIDNSSAIGSSFYFWNNISADKETQVINSTTWAILNASSSTWSQNTNMSGISGSAVRPGQGFLIKALGSTVNFKNTQRSGGPGASTANRSSRDSDMPDGKYWLEFIAPSGLAYSTAVTYGGKGEDGYESFDSKTMGNGTLVYTLLDDNRLIIQGRSNFRIEDTIPLGVSSSESGSSVIRLSKTEGIFEDGRSVILHDRILNTDTDLTKEDYKYNVVKGRTEGRFEIIYRSSSSLSTLNPNQDKGITIYKNADVFVVSSLKIITLLEVYDMSGRLVKKLQTGAKNAEFKLEGEGAYVVRIQTIDGAIFNKKVRN